ncbi:MAG: acyltransferase family protein [Phenylobacterium sp.]|uniref:acyltransferase family protein n=1 Tax=Phenylobacterium sp. TaxID=1871053 RepID=UPI0025D9DD51|nr:acyltransferase family protein [Phenylobacterium sp.]MBI1200060.1 acyltransferase family protein [Phenylobacterium sp.]
MPDGSERLHGLDAVRGYALMLGVVFHATMSFLPGPSVWLVTDVARSPLLGGVFFVSHMFRMTTFFLIAGFFAHMSFHRLGARGFVMDRLKRIALPLVVGWPILLFAILLAGGYAVYVATGVFPTKPPPSPPQPPGAFPLTHLWFLYALLWLYAAVLVLRAGLARADRAGKLRAGVDAIVGAVARHPLGALALAAPAAVALALFPGWLAWFGVPTPDSNLIPNPPAAIQFFAAFAFGWLVHRQVGALEAWRRHWPVNLALAVALTGGLLAVLGLAPVVTPQPPGAAKWALAAAYALASWAWTFAVIGLALRFLSGHSPMRRYIADSSYWIYLIHLPLVIVLQAWVSRFDWPWEAKFVTVLAIGFAIMFASYELLVRHTFVGGVLNGRRRPWRTPKAEPSRLEAAR